VGATTANGVSVIPRLRPWYGARELAAILPLGRDPVGAFEQCFAAAMGSAHAVAFPYGRSALHALLSVLDIAEGVVVLPAYTCVVVANAIVHAGCTPRFVDIGNGDVNMDLDALAAALDDDVRVVLATCMHGFPVDANRLRAVVPENCTIIMDGALAMGTTCAGEPVGRCAHAAIYGLNLGKQLCSLFGGMATTDDADLAAALRRHRDSTYRPANMGRRLWLAAYELAQFVGLWPPVYGFAHWLDRNTPLLSSLTDYYDEDRIDMPADHRTQMSPLQGRLGVIQCAKHPEITHRRRERARLYDDALGGIDGIECQPWVDGASYAQYIIRVQDRDGLVSYLGRQGIEVGTLFSYVVPEMRAYRELGCEGSWPRARALADQVVNLPNYPGLSLAAVERIATEVRTGCTSSGGFR
jgi:perosamine synthetase